MTYTHVACIIFAASILAFTWILGSDWTRRP